MRSFVCSQSHGRVPVSRTCLGWYWYMYMLLVLEHQAIWCLGEAEGQIAGARIYEFELEES